MLPADFYHDNRIFLIALIVMIIVEYFVVSFIFVRFQRWFSRLTLKQGYQKSALRQAQEYERKQADIDQKAQSLGILYFEGKMEHAKTFIEKAENNPPLADALKKAEQSQLFIYADDSFYLDGATFSIDNIPSYLNVDVRKEDARIIESILLGVTKRLEKIAEAKTLKERLRRFGLPSPTLSNKKMLLILLEKAERNYQLEEALKTASACGVKVLPEKKFDIGPGWVKVDVRKENYAIINFLHYH